MNKAFFQILRTKTPLHKRQSEVDMAIEGLMCLGDDIIECYLFDEDLPPAMPAMETSCPDFRTLAGRIIDLTDGFYIGLSSAPIPRECRIKSCDAWVEGIVKEAKNSVQWFENPGKFDSRHTDPEQRRSVFKESLKRIETNMVLLGRHVADTVKMPDPPFTVTISKIDDDCPICSAAKGHGPHGHGRTRGNPVRH